LRVSYSHDLLHRFQQKPFRFWACARWRLTFFSIQSELLPILGDDLIDQAAATVVG
jgi:hypothetical protein